MLVKFESLNVVVFNNFLLITKKFINNEYKYSKVFSPAFTEIKLFIFYKINLVFA